MECEFFNFDTIIFNFAGWIDFRKLINALYLFVCLFYQLMFYYQYLQYTTCLSGITYYASKYHLKSPFICSLKVSLIKNVHVTFSWVPWNFLNNTCGSKEFHGTQATKSQVPWNSMEFCPDPKFHGIPWNLFHTPEFHGVLWNSMDLLIFPKKVPCNSMLFHWTFLKFHGILWKLINLIFKKIYF